MPRGAASSKVPHCEDIGACQHTQTLPTLPPRTCLLAQAVLLPQGWELLKVIRVLQDALDIRNRRLASIAGLQAIRHPLC